MFLSYKQKSEKNKEKIIKRNVKKFKALCLREFQKNIKRGLNVTYVDFFCNVDDNFENEISEKTLKELREEHQNIQFEFCFRHYMNSYKGIKMTAK